MEKLFHSADVLSLLGIKATGRNTRCICPACGSKKFDMQTDGIKDYGHCWGCGFKTNDIGYFAAMTGKDASDKEARREAFVEINKALNVGTTSFKPAKAYKEVENAAIAPIERRDAIYGKMVTSMPLILRHQQDLMSRGLTKAEIKSLEYVSIDKNLAENAVKSLKSAKIKLCGIPGFYKDGMQKVKGGFLLWYRDYHGRKQGAQIRLNKEFIKRDEKGKLKNKYIWLSTKNYEMGTMSPSFVHFACDFDYDFASGQNTAKLSEAIYLTEGALKADICHILSGKPFLAIAGVDATKELKQLLSGNVLQNAGVKMIIDAFDMDYLSNKDVCKSREKLRELVESYGFTYKMLTWNTKADNHADLKGLDDYLMYHKRGI